MKWQHSFLYRPILTFVAFGTYIAFYIFNIFTREKNIDTMDITAYIYIIHILGYQSAVTIQVVFWAEVTSAFLQIIPENKMKHI